MDWNIVSAISDSLAAVAVVATLIYLAIQVRQTKEISKTQAYHLAIEQLVAGSMRPEISLLFESEKRELTKEELFKLSSPLTAVLYGHEIVHYLWKKGQVEEALWQNIWQNNNIL